MPTINQDEPCLALLAGLRDEYKSENNVSFFSDSKEYFASNKFITDYQSGKWNGGISAVIDDSPINLTAGSDETQLHQFQEQIRRGSSLKIQLATYSTISRSTSRADIANAFNDCIGGKFGLSIALEGEKEVGIKIKYKKLADGDPTPMIESADIQGVEETDRQRILDENLKEGKSISEISSWQRE